MCAKPRGWDDFVAFARAMLTSKDEDPFYPVLASLGQTITPEEALWLSFLFVAYCHLGSAWRAWTLTRRPMPLPAAALRWPFYTDRRGLRGGRLAQHVASYLAHIGLDAQRSWLCAGWDRDPVANYARFWEQSQRIWGNGRWAAFKWAEVLKKVHGWRLAAPDMRMQFCSGPKQGLCWLYRAPPTASLAVLNGLGVDLLQRCQAVALDVDWETLETLLCNWHSLVQGRYYVGCDIDAQYDEIRTVPCLVMQARLWETRAAVLPRAYCGEYTGHGGLEVARLQLYRTTGRVVVRDEADTPPHGRTWCRENDIGPDGFAERRLHTSEGRSPDLSALSRRG